MASWRCTKCGGEADGDMHAVMAFSRSHNCTATSFAVALADHLSGRWAPLGHPDHWEAADITGIDVQWGDGEDSTDDYGDPTLRLPYLEVFVNGHGGRRTKAETGWCIENLMRQALGLDLNP